MQRPFKHVILTMFNLKSYADGTQNQELWIQWTENRIGLFREICLPSVVNQTNQNFSWWLCLDSETPKTLVSELENAIKPYINFEIRFFSGYQNFYENYTKEVLEFSKDYKYVMQTRFDNDDVINKHAIQTIQDNFKANDKYFINLTSGFTFEKKTGYLSHYYYSMGPFLTLIEDTQSKIDGIYKEYHWKWPGLKISIIKELLKKINLVNDNKTYICRKPLWIQYIHDNNMHNTAIRGLPVLFQKDLSEFSDVLKMKPSPFHRIVPHYNYVWWKRYLRGFICNILHITP